MTRPTAETLPMTADELVALTVAGAIKLQEANIYGAMDVRPIEPLPPVTYCGHEMHVVPDLQKSGAFKYRGGSAAAWKAASDGHDTLETVSTGSHGVALSMAGAQVGLRTVVHVPDSITSKKERRLKAAGATVVKGGTFGDSKGRAEMGSNGVFIHPFANQEVREGQATLGLELVQYLEHSGLTGFDEDIIIPVSVAGGSHILGIAGPVSVARQEGRLGPGVKVVAVRSKSGNVDALAISEDDRDPINQLVVEDERYVAGTHFVSDKQIGEAIQFLVGRGVVDVESAGALPAAFALAYARRYPYSQGNQSRKVRFVLPVSGTNGSPEDNASFLRAANPPSTPRTLSAAGGLALKPRSGNVNAVRSGLRIGYSPVGR